MTRPSIVREAAPLPTRVLLPLVATLVAASPVGLAAQESAAPPRPGIPSAAALVTTPRGDEDVPDSMFVGVWALTDEHNDLFDVRLDADGGARSNWVKSDAGAEGESARWSRFGSGVRIDYDDGWIDVIRICEQGFEQVSYAPGTPISGPWTNGGKAVRVEGEATPFVGVFRLLDHTGAPFAVSLQSNGLAFKTINEDHRGVWSIEDGAASIRWTDGWNNVIRSTPDGGFEQLSWAPGVPLADAPHVAGDIRRLGGVGLSGEAAPANSREGGTVDRSRFVGTWALTDMANDTFNVVLFPGGAARSTWAKGPEGAKGEWGRWRVYGNGARIDYHNGWIDVVRFAEQGFEQISYTPETPITGPWSTCGRARMIDDRLVPFVGVFEMRMEQDHSPFYVAVQSNGLAFKRIADQPPAGTWSFFGKSAVVRWSDGWTDEFTPLDNGRIAQRTWMPGVPTSEPPVAEQTGRRLKDGPPGPVRPAGSPRPPE
ncbi:MAG: hypothetical protein O2927_03295 [Planctomycetota bacterium]|jgi:hypothetical protein|nr:hypothetical protein [Planctomycetota bacterium]